jgi:hypothetical protein
MVTPSRLGLGGIALVPNGVKYKGANREKQQLNACKDAFMVCKFAFIQLE